MGFPSYHVLLFTYREMPGNIKNQALLYGQDVWGLLDVLKEWIYNQEMESDVLRFLMDMKERMQGSSTRNGAIWKEETETIL